MDIFRQRQIFNILLSIIVILNVFFIIYFITTNHQKRMEHRDFKRIKGLEKEVNLTPDQHRKMMRYRKDHEKKLFAKRDEIDEYRELIFEELFKDNPDENKIAELSKKIADSRIEIETDNYGKYIKVINLLSDEQKIPYKELLELRFIKGPGEKEAPIENMQRPDRPPHREHLNPLHK